MMVLNSEARREDKLKELLADVAGRDKYGY